MQEENWNADSEERQRDAEENKSFTQRFHKHVYFVVGGAALIQTAVNFCTADSLVKRGRNLANRATVKVKY